MVLPVTFLKRPLLCSFTYVYVYIFFFQILNWPLCCSKLNTDRNLFSASLNSEMTLSSYGLSEVSIVLSGTYYIQVWFTGHSALRKLSRRPTSDELFDPEALFAR